MRTLMAQHDHQACKAACTFGRRSEGLYWAQAKGAEPRAHPRAFKTKCHKRKSDPYGTRTRVTAVKGRCPRPLDEGAGAKSIASLRSCNQEAREASRVHARATPQQRVPRSARSTQCFSSIDSRITGLETFLNRFIHFATMNRHLTWGFHA